MTKPPSDHPMLPGLEPPAPTASTLEVAVRRTLAALDADDVLHEVDAARIALAVELAQIISDKRRTGRTSTVGNDARVMVEILDGLAPAPEAGGGDAGLRAAMEAWEKAVNEGQAPAPLPPLTGDGVA